MLRFDKKNKKLSKIHQTNLKNEDLLERIESWDSFRKEIGFSFFTVHFIVIYNFSCLEV